MSVRSLLFAGVTLAAASCSGGEGRAPPPDAARPPHEARRIVSLIPSATETIVAMGAADRLIARTEFDHEPSLARLPSVGEGLTPSLERLAELRPDLVVAWPDNPSRSLGEQLGRLGVAVYSPTIQTLDDIRRTARQLGQLLGLEARADSLVQALDAGLEAVRRAVAGRDRPSVLYAVWYDPVTTAGSGTYIDELIELAGGRNVFADAPGLWPRVSLEEVVRRQPDIVLLPSSAERPLDPARLRSAVGWRELEAVREGRVLRMDAELLNRPGPRVVEAARQLARLLHPGVRRLELVP